MSLVIQPIKGNKFFEALGVACGRITNDAGSCVEFFTVAHGQSVLKEAVGKSFCNADEAQKLEEQMVAAGILPDDAAVFSHIVGRANDQTEMGNIRFEFCSRCGMPLPHGRIYTEDEALTRPIATQGTLFEALQELVLEEELTVLQAANIFKQAVDGEVCFDETELGERYTSLPEETRAKVDEQRQKLLANLGQPVTALRVNFGGGMGATVLDVNLPAFIARALFGSKGQPPDAPTPAPGDVKPEGPAE